MTDAIKLAIERAWPDGEPNWLPTDDEGVALFKLECEALAALRAQPAEPFKKLSDDQILWIAESHGIDPYASNPLAFYNDLISTTPAQPDHIVDASMIKWPEADTHCVDTDTGLDVWSHSTEQLKQAVRDALEGAAKACQKLEVAIDGGGNTYYRPADARQCVAAIRALIKEI